MWSLFFKHFYAFLIWVGPSKRVQELCFDMLCSIFTHIFFSSPSSQDLLIWWGHCVHELSSHKAVIVSVVHARLRCRPAPGRKDTAECRDRDSRAALTLCVFLCGGSMLCIQRRSDSRTCWTDQLAGWFKTFDSWPASVMAISFGTSIEKIQ